MHFTIKQQEHIRWHLQPFPWKSLQVNVQVNHLLLLIPASSGLCPPHSVDMSWCWLKKSELLYSHQPFSLPTLEGHCGQKPRLNKLTYLYNLLYQSRNGLILRYTGQSDAWLSQKAEPKDTNLTASRYYINPDFLILAHIHIYSHLLRLISTCVSTHTFLYIHQKIDLISNEGCLYFFLLLSQAKVNSM